MTTIRPLKATDLLALERVNLGDAFVTTFDLGFYLEYLAKWPIYCHVALGPDGRIEGYSMWRPFSTDAVIGKAEASAGRQIHSNYPDPYNPRTNKNEHYLPWHAHITALAVAKMSRGQGIARRLTELFEEVANRDDAWFVDLFVREDNAAAIEMYKKMGYSVFRRVVGYYSDDMDGLDMRKPMARDAEQLHVRSDGDSHAVDPSVVW